MDPGRQFFPQYLWLVAGLEARCLVAVEDRVLDCSLVYIFADDLVIVCKDDSVG